MAAASTPEATVQRLRASVLGKPLDEAGARALLEQHRSLPEVRRARVTSAGAKTAVDEAYRRVLARGSDAGGQAAWHAQIVNGRGLDDIERLARSPEGQRVQAIRTAHPRHLGRPATDAEVRAVIDEADARKWPSEEDAHTWIDHRVGSSPSALAFREQQKKDKIAEIDTRIERVFQRVYGYAPNEKELTARRNQLLDLERRGHPYSDEKFQSGLANGPVARVIVQREYAQIVKGNRAGLPFEIPRDQLDLAIDKLANGGTIADLRQGWADQVKAGRRP